MTDHTEEELIALAKLLFGKHGARLMHTEHGHEVMSIRPEQFEMFIHKFAHALRQQDLARMARMREALENITDSYEAHIDHPYCSVIDTYSDEIKEARDALSETSDIQDWLDGQRLPDAPKEWQLVPKEPTQAMIDASNGCFGLTTPMAPNWQVQHIGIAWHAMLKAAPSARSAKGEE